MELEARVCLERVKREGSDGRWMGGRSAPKVGLQPELGPSADALCESRVRRKFAALRFCLKGKEGGGDTGT